MAKRTQGAENKEGVKWGKVKETRLDEIKRSLSTVGEAAMAAFRAFALAKGDAEINRAFRAAVDAAVTYREAVAERDDLEKSIAHDKLMGEVRGLSNTDLSALIERVKAEAQKAAAATEKRNEEHKSGKANPEVSRA